MDVVFHASEPVILNFEMFPCPFFVVSVSHKNVHNGTERKHKALRLCSLLPRLVFALSKVITDFFRLAKIATISCHIRINESNMIIMRANRGFSRSRK